MNRENSVSGVASCTSCQARHLRLVEKETTKVTNNMLSIEQQAVFTNTIHHAIDSRRKLKFRLRSTPSGRYNLFHPYSLFEDKLSGIVKVYGLIEKHYTNGFNDQLYCLAIGKLSELLLIDDSFTMQYDWKSKIDINRYRQSS